MDKTSNEVNDRLNIWQLTFESSQGFILSEIKIKYEEVQIQWRNSHNRYGSEDTQVIHMTWSFNYIGSII